MIALYRNYLSNAITVQWTSFSIPAVAFSILVVMPDDDSFFCKIVHTTISYFKIVFMK